MTTLTQPPTSRLTVLVIGEQSLAIECCDLLRAGGHTIAAVVATDVRVRGWCADHGTLCLSDAQAALDTPEASAFDYLLSITNLRVVPPAVLARARFGAINFHDGPLPRYAGLNAPAWALMAGEREHGITWHFMEAEVDTGAVLLSRAVPIEDDDTSFTLNARCYEAGIATFAELLGRLASGTAVASAQDLSRRTFFGRTSRPRGLATLDWRRSAEDLERLVRGLDFGPYPNPLCLPKLWFGSSLLTVRSARLLAGGVDHAPGTIEALSADRLSVRCSSGSLELTDITDVSGAAVDLEVLATAQRSGVGGRLATLPDSELDALDELGQRIGMREARWRARLRRFTATPIIGAGAAAGSLVWQACDHRADSPSAMMTAIVLTMARMAQSQGLSFAFTPSARTALARELRAYVSAVMPVEIAFTDADLLTTVRAAIEEVVGDAEQSLGLPSDLMRDAVGAPGASVHDAPLRLVRTAELPEGVVPELAGAAILTFVISDDGRLGVTADAGRLAAGVLDEVVDSIGSVVAQLHRGPQRVGDIDVLTPAQRLRLAQSSSGPDLAPSSDGPGCVHELFEAQVARTPDRVACVCRDQQLTYRDLNQAANRLARQLRDHGVTTGDRVAVMVERSLEMVIALYAVHKAGAAYVPLDPEYPSERLRYMLADADVRCAIVRTQSSNIDPAIPQIAIDASRHELDLPSVDNLGVPVTAECLAYLIYTSGSSGMPKGVMVEHRNVVNFFAGMDRRIDATPGTWLAVTSISFDISVLELFWTLTRGFTVVLHAEGAGSLSPAAPPPADLGMQFGLFYWNVASREQDDAPDKYRLLIEGAKFADSHGFNAVWTPERHFESFGGLFPNPAITSAALAAVTTHVALRAGSCVVPLHSPIRIAEEWAVVDNLSNGRAGISVAAGWAAPDFAIRPEAFARAKDVMFENTDIVRRLWRGEAVEFPGPKGPVAVRTLPRPIQRELPIWVTTAGNVETFVQAGRMGGNLLTHLLGQTIDEVAGKVRAYRQAWRESGHPGEGTVTLMLHTFVGADETQVEQTVERPLKEYLRSAAFLVKSAAWQFPTFKRLSESQGQTLDEFFETISDTDMEALLDFAFQRYFRTSGLFGTVDHCLQMVSKVRAAGVDEIACLIDFGIDTDTVLRHLPHLDALRVKAQHVRTDERYSLTGILRAGGITHFQCTPSMARMVLAEPDARIGLSGLREWLVGGEALPPDVATELHALAPGRVINMYGPTETTVWSTAGRVTKPGGPVSIGTPLSNQQVYVLDARGRQLPPGVAGELAIGGQGVTRGYWKADTLTRERFQPLPLPGQAGGRIYRTGDLGRVRRDGEFECLGRIDQQIKIRGHRVEPGEIEARLSSYAGIAEAVVVMREDTPGDQRLVAYLRLTDDVEPKSEELRGFIRERLPDYMVPSSFVTLKAMPRTPNGKLDRRLLPVPRPSSAPVAALAPTTRAESLVAEVWQRALGVPACGRHDNFFDLGGHSLLIVQVLAELRKKVSKPLELTDLFKYTTIEALAAFIDGDVKTVNPQAGARGLRRREALNRRGRS